MSAPDLVRLLEHAAGLLRADEGRHGPAQFPVAVEGGEALCVARLVWRLDDAGPRVVVADVATGRTLCQSLPGVPFDLDHHADDSRGGADVRACEAAALAPGALPPPPYLAHLVARAASRLQAQGWHQSAAFTWWSPGHALTCTARIDWAPAELAPRVVVFDGLTGDFMCRSLPGRLHEMDPCTWSSGETAPDLMAEYEHQQRAGRRSGARGRGQAA